MLSIIFVIFSVGDNNIMQKKLDKIVQSIVKKDLWRLDVLALVMKQFFNLLECLLPPSACLSGMQENKTWSQTLKILKKCVRY